MDQKAGIEQIRKACNQMAIELMRMHPAVAALTKQEAKDEMYKALYRITTDVETIKKLMRKTEGEDQTSLL
jgi:thymidylate synthase ThyX